MTGDGRIPAVIRSFERRDAQACRALYYEGLMGGHIAANDTGYDMDHIYDVYMKCPGSHFWVAESAFGQIVGMIGVQHHDDGNGQIRRLRVRPEFQPREIGAALLETALQFCHEKNYLKVTLDTFVDGESAVKLFEKFRFRLDHTRSIGQKELAYFYLDLYAGSGRRPGDVQNSANNPPRPPGPG